MIRGVTQRQAMDCAEGEIFLFFISTGSSPKDAVVRSHRQSMKFFIIVALLFNRDGKLFNAH